MHVCVVPGLLKLQMRAHLALCCVFVIETWVRMHLKHLLLASEPSHRPSEFMIADTFISNKLLRLAFSSQETD